MRVLCLRWGLAAPRLPGAADGLGRADGAAPTQADDRVHLVLGGERGGFGDLELRDMRQDVFVGHQQVLAQRSLDRRNVPPGARVRGRAEHHPAIAVARAQLTEPGHCSRAKEDLLGV